MKGLIYCFLLFFVGCGTSSDHLRKVGREAVTATCERIIVCHGNEDILDYPRISLVVSFKNHTDKRVYLLTNKIYSGGGLMDSKYFYGGVMLQTNNLVTPIGALTGLSLILIEPNSVLKLFFIYSRLYPNKWEGSDKIDEDLNELMKLAESIKLAYHFNEKAYLMMDNSCFLEDKKGYLLSDDIPIKMEQTEIEHRCDITSDDVAEMVGGTVIIGDSLPKQPKLLPDDYFKH